jgi:hypothetical protein
MASASQTEAALDEALAYALFNDRAFASWFFGQTPVFEDGASCVFCRCDNPWSTVFLEVPNALSGVPEVLTKQCETDILAVYQTAGGRRVGLHIENKLAAGTFTPNQPELYLARRDQWKQRDKLGLYTEAITVLVAPIAFRERHLQQSSMFDCFISHESIGEKLDAFRAGALMPNKSLERTREG